MAKVNKNVTLSIAILLIQSPIIFLLLFNLGLPLLTTLLLTLGFLGLNSLFLVITFIYRSNLQKRAFAGKKQAGTDTSSHQKRTVEIDLLFDEAYDLALDALQSLDDKHMPVADDPLIKVENLGIQRKQRVVIKEDDREMGVIKARFHAGIFGRKDPIAFSKTEIRLQRIDTQTTRISIESQPNGIVDEFDMGKNLHYVNHMALYLRSQSQHTQAESRLKLKETAIVDDVQDIELKQHKRQK